MRKLCAIGEALIDFIPNRTNIEIKDATQFSRQVGGAPVNVASVVKKLGSRAETVTQLGNDAFGNIIVETLEKIGVGATYIKRTHAANTAFVFVSLEENRERDFSFYRKPSADMLYHTSNLNEINISNQDVLHPCSVDLIECDMKNAHFAMIEGFEAAHGVIVFDLNVRLPLWDSMETCKATIQSFLPKANIIEISDEETEFVTETSDEHKAIQSLFKRNVEAVIYTQGDKGATAYLKDGTIIHHQGYKVEAVDTTGTGDTFIGAVVNRILNTELTDITSPFKEKGEETLKFSNSVAAKVTTKHGTIESIPSLEEVIEELKKRS